MQNKALFNKKHVYKHLFHRYKLINTRHLYKLTQHHIDKTNIEKSFKFIYFQLLKVRTY